MPCERNDSYTKIVQKKNTPKITLAAKKQQNVR